MSAQDDIEKVALAIFATEYGEADLSWDDVGEYTRETYRIMAKAAILATLDIIGNPPMTLIRAALAKVSDRKDATEIFQRLVDAKRAEIES